MSNRSDEPLLRATNLTKYYDASEGFIDSLLGREQLVKAVDGVDVELYEGETLGVVGESGCGKTTLGRSLIRLLEPTAGSIVYDGEELTEASSGRLRELRTDIQYIFQDPFSSLNPRLTVGDIIGEPLKIHDIATGKAQTDRIYELLDIVGLNPSHADRYPHEFSGGQRQRIGIARALAVDPKVIICDEPVSALDVSVQAQILNLLEDLQAEFDLSYLFIAHDLSVVEHISDRIGVMYLGEFAEIGPTEDIFAPPHHPYTEVLLSAIPEPDPQWEADRTHLSGDVPSPINPPSGCRFHTRCPSIIQPTEYDVEQSVWRSLIDLKIRIAGAESVDVLTATESGHSIGLGLPGVSELPLDDAAQKTRDVLDIPETISDRRIKQELRQLLERIRTAGGGSSTVELPAPEEASLQEPMEAFCESLAVEPAGQNRQLERIVTDVIGLINETEFSSEDGTTDPSKLSLDKLDSQLRTEFDLPETIGDRQLEQLLSQIIEQLHDGELDSARQRLEDDLNSPCEEHDPEQVPVGDNHRIACLLYDGRYVDGQFRSSNHDELDASADD